VETAPKTLSIEIPDFEGELKIHVFPQGRNDLLVRIENLADLFDKTPETTPMFDLRTYAMNLYSANNAGSSDIDIKVTERNLSNNQDYSDMIAAKFEWKTRDGPSSVVYPADQEADAVVALQPQRIRVFRVQY